MNGQKPEVVPSFESNINLLDKAKCLLEAHELSRQYGTVKVIDELSALDAHLASGKIELIVITAWLCHELLAKRNKRNRDINPKNVIRFRNLIHADKFRFTGGSALFYSDGTVADCQHRLAACAIEGVPFAIVVVPNWKDKDMPLVDDRCLNRKASGMLKLAGAPNSGLAASIVSNLLRYRQTGSLKGNMPNNSAISDEYDASKALVIEASEFAIGVNAKYPDRNALSQDLVGSLYAIAKVVNEDAKRFGAFLERLVSGEKVAGEEPKPYFIAGEVLENTKVSGKSKGLPDNIRASVAISAYKTEIVGKTVNKIAIPKKVDRLPTFPSQELEAAALSAMKEKSAQSAQAADPDADKFKESGIFAR